MIYHIVTTPPQMPVSDFGSSTPPRQGVLWKWSLAVTAAALLFLMWQCGSSLYRGRTLANTAVQRFHRELNTAQYEAICSEADDAFNQSDQHDQLLRFLQGVHTKLGAARTESLNGIRVNATAQGTFIVTSYQTTFERGAAVETFTWVKSAGSIKLYSYNVQSNALIFN
jgi:hypothetical protein